MEKKYVVGIDFGHGETAAWLVPLDPIEANAKYGESLRLKATNHENLRMLPSVIYADKKASFSLDNTVGDVVTCFKGKVANLELAVNRKKKNAYISYIKEIYKKLLELNTKLKSDGKGNTNFYLCIACPTKWEQDDKDDYIKFFNSALQEFNVKVMWVINESDAAYFTHGSSEEYAKQCVLVIDYGSSTIDYTVIDNGEKISDDNWSNAQLGASNIERAILEACRNDRDFQGIYAATQQKLNESGMDYISILSRLEFEMRKEKERSVTDSYYPNFGFNYNLVGTQTGYGGTKEYEAEKRRYKFEYDGNVSMIVEIKNYIEAVCKDFKTLRQNIAAKTKNKGIDCVILSGGACQMPWVKKTVEEIFKAKTIEVDNLASFVVAKGVTLYAKAQIEALELLKNKIRTINFAQIYEDADSNATVSAIKSMMPDMIRTLKSKSNVTGNVVRRDFCDFIKGLDDKNYRYCQLVQEELDALISRSIAGAIHEAIRFVFKISIDTKDVKLHVGADVIPWNTVLFEPEGTFYEAFTNWIDSTSGRFIFTWDKVRVNPERDKIIDGTADTLIKVASNNRLADYPKELVNHFAENIQKQAISIAEELFYEKQLFKTTFAK